MQGVLTKGIELGYKTSGSGETYTKIAGLQEFPDIGGAPEQIDITTLDDAMMHYMNGLKDVGSMEFTFLYDKQDNATSNYQILCGLEDAGNVVSWEVKLPTGTKFHWDGEVAVTLSGDGVNAALHFVANIGVATDIQRVYATA